MLEKISKISLTIIGLVIGYVLGEYLIKIVTRLGITILNSSLNQIIFMGGIVLIFGIIFYFFISSLLYKGIIKVIDTIEKNLQKFSASELIFGTIGVIVSLVIVLLIGMPILAIHPILGPALYILIDIVAVVIGVKIFIGKREDISQLLDSIKKNTNKDKKQKQNIKSIPKVLDTSVIIDGRIFDICQTGFVEGPLIIPSFVLDELRHISDSADSLKRNRGRRGLDILNKIQKELDIATEIWEGDFKEIDEVDSKLLKLAQKLNGKVVTNDFNLNKVAEVQGVPVLNINELANAIKPVLLPGEEMKMVVIKDGKESSQGIGYLDDGTMIVVEDGRKHIGEEILIIVTSVIQTAAGRMIFAKPKES